MKSILEYIDTKSPDYCSDYTGKYGITAAKESVPQPLDELVITGAGSRSARKKYLADLINSCEFNAKKIVDTLNSDGCTYTTWSVQSTSDSVIYLYTIDKYGNKLFIIIKKR